jgi:hypothetical protein
MASRDRTLDVLLDLDGQVFVVDPECGYWVRFVVTKVPESPAKPHAHPIGKRLRSKPHDHRHRSQTLKPYNFRDAATLLADFWAAVDTALRDQGVIP